MKSGSTFSASLLIAGTTIGAGMLALPFVTGVAGFGPAIVVNTVCWLFMVCTGLLFLEVTLWMPDGSNILSMSHHFLGRTGYVIGGLAFIFLYYCLLIAYFSGGVPLFQISLNQLLSVDLSLGSGYWIYGGIFLCLLWLGGTWIGRVNVILMAGLIISYLLLIGSGSSEVQGSRLTGGDWVLAIGAAPTLFSAYGYHNVVPSVTTYLKRNPVKMRTAIIIGTLIPFIVYTLWQMVVIGVLPTSVIESTVDSGAPITQPLESVVQHRFFALTARYFSLFAIVTSLLGVAFSVVDFLGDGTGWPRYGWRRGFLCLIALAPPAIFAWMLPGIFFSALKIAGGIGEALLNGLLPILMVWVGRYIYKYPAVHRLRGGRLTLTILLVITLFILGYEAIHL